MNNKKEIKDIVDKLNQLQLNLTPSFLIDNTLANLLKISSHETPINSFSNIFFQLNTKSNENVIDYVSNASCIDYTDNPTFSLSVSNLSMKLIEKLSNMKLNNVNNQSSNLLSQIIDDYPTLSLDNKKYTLNLEQANALLSKRYLVHKDFVDYVTNNHPLHNDKQIRKFNNFLTIVQNLPKNDIIPILDKYVNSNSLAHNFLEENYSHEQSFLQNLCYYGKADIAYELVKKYNFPIQHNCHFISEINNLEMACKFIKDFNIDIYNSINESSINRNKSDTELITPYEHLVKSSNPYKTDILKFAANNSIQDKDYLKIMGAKEFCTFVEGYTTKKEILSYLEKNNISFENLHKVELLPDSRRSSETTLLNIISNRHLWWLYPILNEKKSTQLVDKRGYVFLNSILNHTENNKINYAKLFYSNLELSLSKNIISDSVSQLDNIINVLLNSTEDSSYYIQNPKKDTSTKDFYTRNNHRITLKDFSPLFVNYTFQQGTHFFYKNESLDIIYKFISKELNYISDDIPSINNEIKDCCIKYKNNERATCKQFFYYSHCLHDYIEKQESIIDFKNLNTDSFLEIDTNDFNYNSRTIEKRKVFALLENIIIAEKYFPDNLGSQKENTSQIFEKIILKLFKSLNSSNVLTNMDIFNEDITLITEMINFSTTYNTEHQILASPETRNELRIFFDNSNNITSNHDFNNLKLLVESEYLNHDIPLSADNDRKVPKF